MGPHLAADIQCSVAARLLGIHRLNGAASNLRLCTRQESSGIPQRAMLIWNRTAPRYALSHPLATRNTLAELRYFSSTDLNLHQTQLH